jgi:hypothetical protein
MLLPAVKDRPLRAILFTIEGPCAGGAKRLRFARDLVCSYLASASGCRTYRLEAADEFVLALDPLRTHNCELVCYELTASMSALLIDRFGDGAPVIEAQFLQMSSSELEVKTHMAASRA